MADWDARWLDLAGEVAKWSKDRSTKVGCIVVGDGKRLLCCGYNGFPRGIDDDTADRHERPLKYMLTEHAERNAIYNAAREGVDLHNSVMYSTLYPCADCARGIIQSGIAEVVTREPDWNLPIWGFSFTVSRIMLQEAGVHVRLVAP